MKKISALIFALLIGLTPVSAFAEPATIDETMIMMGDLNEDGEATASDARKVLRIAAELDSAEGIHMLSADADGNGELTATDARIILRVSAGLSKFTYGFDGKGTPCALNVIYSNSYSLEASFHDSAFTNGEAVFALAKNNDDVYFSCDDLTKDMGLGLNGMNIISLDIMIAGNVFFIVLNKNIAMPIPDSMLTDMGMEKTEIYEYVDMISGFLPENIGQATKTTLNGNDVFRYTYTAMDQKCYLYVKTNGQPIGIYGTDSNGNTVHIVGINSISGDSVSSYFDLNNYTIF